MSLTSNPNMTPSEILQLNLNDSALDLLNAAIASHQVKVDNSNNNSNSNDDSSKKSDASSKKSASKDDKEASLSPQTSSVHVHTKRELDKDEETSSTAPKRAGRKPLDKTQISDAPLDPKQKRKAQNRAAQRAFRDRKEKHVAELQARIAELEALNATKDEDLVKENKQLKEMLQKLQEENYALKGAQFTFEFPVNDSTQANAFALASNNNNNNSTATPITDMSHRSSSDKSSMYQTTTSGSSMSSNNSYSGEDVASSAEQSPLSNSHTHEDDSTSADTPINSVFSAEPMQFGLIHQQQPSLQAQQPSMNNSLDFFAVSDNSGFNTQQTNSFPTGDLFHGKDDLFANYRVPTTNNANDDFLFANEDLSGLFGGTDDLFGLGNSAQLNMAAQFGLPETPASRRLNLTADKKEMLLSKLKQGQQEGKFIYQVHQDIKQQCPDFNLDLLCDELKKKASCSMSSYPLTDHDVDAFVKCLDRI